MQPIAAPEPDLRARARALLVGMALGEARAGGDALSCLALALGDSILEAGGLDQADLLRRWSAVEAEHPLPPSSITAQALRLHRRGFPAEGLGEAAARIRPGRSGDGALVRALPLALAARRQGGLLKRWAAESAVVTHADETSAMAAVAAALLARDLLGRGLAESLARVGQALREEGPPRLSRVLRLPKVLEEPEPGDDAVATLSQAIHALHRSRDLSHALDRLQAREEPGPGALALTGALAGAALGLGAAGGAEDLDPTVRERAGALADRLVAFEVLVHLSAPDRATPLRPLGGAAS